MKRIFCMFEVHAAAGGLRGILTYRGYLSCIPEAYSRLDVSTAKSRFETDEKTILAEMRKSPGIAAVNKDLKIKFMKEFERAEEDMLMKTALLLPVFSLVSWLMAVGSAIRSGSSRVETLPLGAMTLEQHTSVDWKFVVA